MRGSGIIVGAVGLCTFAAGWLSGAPGAAAPSAAEPRAETPVKDEQSIARAALRAPPRPTLEGSARTVFYPNLKLNDEEKELLSMTPEEAIAKGDAGGASTSHIARCRELMPDAPAALCQRIDRDMHDLRLANLRGLREFLTGTVEVSKFQEDYHRNLVAFQVALEGYLSFDQMMEYATVQPGDDPFLVMTGWGFALPPGYTIGEDILSRTDSDPTDSGSGARDPFTYGKQHWPGQQH